MNSDDLLKQKASLEGKDGKEVTMRETLEVEQFDNGISFRSVDVDINNTDPIAEVALTHNQEAALGKLLWADIKYVIDANLCNKVRVTINVEHIKTK